jgi:predicted transcriptional regulator
MPTAETSLVRDRMTSPALTQPADAAIPSVIALLEARAVSAVPVVSAGRLVGIVSTTDLVAANARDRRPETVADCMTSPVVTVGPDETVEAAAHRLVDAHIHRVVVTENDRVVGVLSARDMLEDVKRRRIELPIAHVMTRDVQTVDVGDTIDAAIERLVAGKVHGLVVLDGTWPVGAFTHAEALAARRLPPSLRSGPVEEVMSYETICLDQATPVYRAAAYAIAMNVRRLLVVDHRALVGVMSVVDLLDVFVRLGASDPIGGENR